MMNLDEALAHVADHGFGDLVEADQIISQAAAGLAQIYHRHSLHEVSASSAADQCADLYDLYNQVGLPVA